VFQLQHGKNMDCVRKGAWSHQEDKKLIDYIAKYRIWNWSQMPKFAGTTSTPMIILDQILKIYLQKHKVLFILAFFCCFVITFRVSACL